MPLSPPGRKRKPASSVQTSHGLELAHYQRELATYRKKSDELWRETERLRATLDGKESESMRIKHKALERKRELGHPWVCTGRQVTGQSGITLWQSGGDATTLPSLAGYPRGIQ